jgi:hypothetical protein
MPASQDLEKPEGIYETINVQGSQEEKNLVE